MRKAGALLALTLVGCGQIDSRTETVADELAAMGLPSTLEEVVRTPEAGEGAGEAFRSAAPDVDPAQLAFDASSLADDIVVSGLDILDPAVSQRSAAAFRALAQRAALQDDADDALADLQALQRLKEMFDEKLLTFSVIQHMFAITLRDAQVAVAERHPERKSDVIAMIEASQPIDWIAATAGDSIWSLEVMLPESTDDDLAQAGGTEEQFRAAHLNVVDFLTAWRAGEDWTPSALDEAGVFVAWEAVRDLQRAEVAHRRIALLTLGGEAEDVDPFLGQPFERVRGEPVSVGPDLMIGTENDVKIQRPS